MLKSPQLMADELSMTSSTTGGIDTESIYIWRWKTADCQIPIHMFTTIDAHPCNTHFEILPKSCCDVVFGENRLFLNIVFSRSLAWDFILLLLLLSECACFAENNFHIVRAAPGTFRIVSFSSVLTVRHVRCCLPIVCYHINVISVLCYMQIFVYVCNESIAYGRSAEFCPS